MTLKQNQILLNKNLSTKNIIIIGAIPQMYTLFIPINFFTIFYKVIPLLK